MVQTIEGLAQVAAELPLDQRYTLARRILASIETSSEEPYAIAWKEEISQRMMRFDSGETAGIPAEKVFTKIEQSLA